MTASPSRRLDWRRAPRLRMPSPHRSFPNPTPHAVRRALDDAPYAFRRTERNERRTASGTRPPALPTDYGAPDVAIASRSGGVVSFQMYFENHSQLCQLAASCSLGFVIPWPKPLYTTSRVGTPTSCSAW